MNTDISYEDIIKEMAETQSTLLLEKAAERAQLKKTTAKLEEVANIAGMLEVSAVEKLERILVALGLALPTPSEAVKD